MRNYSDSIAVNRVSVEYALTKKLSLQLAYEQIQRKGNNETKGLSQTATEKRMMSSIKYIF